MYFKTGPFELISFIIHVYLQDWNPKKFVESKEEPGM